MAFDTTRIADQITKKGCLPTGRYTDDELLDTAYDVMLSEIVPIVLEVREEYYGRSSNAAITAGVEAYPIVSRALSGVLREVKMIEGSNIIDLVRTDIEDVTEVKTGKPELFYIQGNDIVLWPTPDATSGLILRQSYFLRPSRFVSVAECAVITAIDTLTNTVTVTIPTGWSTTSAFDLVKGRAHYDIIAMDLAASSVAAGQIVFTSSLPASLIVGDYVTLAEESCFPFLPIEGHMALVQASAAAALEEMGDPKAESVAAKAKMLKDNFKTVLSVRVQGAPKRLAARVL